MGELVDRLREEALALGIARAEPRAL